MKNIKVDYLFVSYLYSSILLYFLILFSNLFVQTSIKYTSTIKDIVANIRVQ